MCWAVPALALSYNCWMFIPSCFLSLCCANGYTLYLFCLYVCRGNVLQQLQDIWLYVLELQTQVYFTSMYGIHLPLQCLSSNHVFPSCQAKRVLGLQGVLNANKLFGNLAGCFHLHFLFLVIGSVLQWLIKHAFLIYSTCVQEKPHKVLALVRMVVMVNDGLQQWGFVTQKCSLCSDGLENRCRFQVSPPKESHN